MGGSVVVNETKYLSRRGIPVRMPESGHRCVFCKDKIVKGSQTYRFANIDPKDVRIAYVHTHISCADKRFKSQAEMNIEVSVVSDEKIREFWTGVEALMKRRNVK